MPSSALITPLGRALLDDLPPILRGDPDIQGVMHAAARELEAAEAKIEQMRAELSPLTATATGLRIWEAQLGLPINTAATDTERRTTVLAHLAKMAGDPSGTDWVANVTKLIGPGWTYEEYLPPSDRVTNLLTNPSGENDTATWQGAGGGVLSRVTSWASSGAASFSVVGSGTDVRMEATDAAMLVVSPGERYSAAAEPNVIDAGADGATIALEFYTAAPAFVSGVYVGPANLKAGTGLGRVKLENVEVPSTAARMRTSIRSRAAVSETHDFRADSLIVVKGKTVPAYADGASAGWEWLGAAHASQSRKTSPPAYTLRITLPFAPTSGAYAQTERLLRDITPAHLDLILTSTAGFQLDRSQLDQEPLRY
ncbi:MAG: YmfQ family protein [Chloroflexi bacterium]|nr:YmfQ family protein [Chloroflexota bacterium]